MKKSCLHKCSVLVFLVCALLLIVPEGSVSAKMLFYNMRPQEYDDKTATITYNGELLAGTKLHPSYIINSVAMLEAKYAAEHIPGMTYSYKKSREEIILSYKDVVLKMHINSSEYEVNGIIISNRNTPILIGDCDTGKTKVYIPGETVFKMLGFDYSWNGKSVSSVITSKENSGKYIPEYETVVLENGNADSEDVKLTSKESAKVLATLGEYAADEKRHTDYHANLVVPFPEEVKVKKLKIQYDYHFHRIRIDLSGDFRDFYRSTQMIVPQNAVEQLQVLYYPKSNITQINIYTKTDSTGMILDAAVTQFSHKIVLTTDKPKALHEKIIVLDAGHGGHDPGAVRKGISEKNLNFAIVNKYCKELFDASDIYVYYTRYDDSFVPLFTRATFAGKLDADLFVSVHQNAAGSSSAKGTGVFYGDTNTGEFVYGSKKNRKVLTSKVFAEQMLDSLVSALGSRRYGALPESYSVVSLQNSVPAVLIEVGFMTNSSELEKLSEASYQKKVAQAIYGTVSGYYKKR